MKKFSLLFFLIFITVFFTACGVNAGRATISPTSTIEPTHNAPTNTIAPTHTVAPTTNNNEVQSASLPNNQDVNDEKLSTFTTTFLDKQEGRVANIKLASEAINDKILKTGEVFSFNETVGPRTAKRGYQKATILVGKKKEKGIGGGICQVSSTIYQAALAADLEIVERHKHKGPVGYIEEGKDATVASNLDFKFKNTLDNDVRIKISSNEGSVTVDIFKVL